MAGGRLCGLPLLLLLLLLAVATAGALRVTPSLTSAPVGGAEEGSGDAASGDDDDTGTVLRKDDTDPPANKDFDYGREWSTGQADRGWGQAWLVPRNE